MLWEAMRRKRPITKSFVCRDPGYNFEEKSSIHDFVHIFIVILNVKINIREHKVKLFFINQIDS